VTKDHFVTLEGTGTTVRPKGKGPQVTYLKIIVADQEPKEFEFQDGRSVTDKPPAKESAPAPAPAAPTGATEGPTEK
jgi:hypothetical protein